MKCDDTKKNFTALSGNDLATLLFHYLSFPCFFAFVTISEVCRLMRYRSVTNVLFRFFYSENRNFLIKRNVIAKSMDNLLPMQEKEKKNKMFVSQGVPML